MNLKICCLILLIFIYSPKVFSQKFNLNIYRYQQSCTKEINYCMDEPQTRWYLSPERAILGLASRANINSVTPILVFSITKVEYDSEKDYYSYTFYDAKKNKYGIIVYFKPRNYLSLQYQDTECSITYEFF